MIRQIHQTFSLPNFLTIRYSIVKRGYLYEEKFIIIMLLVAMFMYALILNDLALCDRILGNIQFWLALSS